MVDSIHCQNGYHSEFIYWQLKGKICLLPSHLKVFLRSFLYCFNNDAKLEELFYFSFSKSFAFDINVMKGNRIECDNISLTYSLSLLYVLVVFQKPYEKCNIMPLANIRQKQLFLKVLYHYPNICHIL